MFFHRFDICEAWYLWLSHNHGGQWSLEYERLCRLSEIFRPGANLSLDTLTENGRAIYGNIERKKQ